ncbi:MAG: DNA repair protein RecO [Candidatus Omnitrophica bacterium]|nr:DNA repair protein RecO [Candidatus Omnitrophota bacterium]
MALTRTNAFIIQSKRFRETSLFIIYYTLNFGKINAIAKGVIGTKKPPLFHLFPSYVELFLYRKESALSLVSSSDLLDPFPKLHQDLKKLSYSLYILELLKETIKENEKNSSLFWLLLKTFKLLEEAEEPNLIELVLVAFQLKFLKVLGYGPFLNNCVSCQEKIEKNLPSLRLSAKAGGVLCRRCSRDAGESLSIGYPLVALMNYLLDLKFSLLPRLKVPVNLRKELIKYVNYFRTYHLPVSQKSLELLKSIEENA